MGTELTVFGVLSLGLGLGVLHAFDLDHLAAVSSLSAREGSWKRGVHYSFLWSLGHGGVLVIVGVFSLLLQMTLPESIVVLAEQAVGIILIVAGSLMLWRLLLTLRTKKSVSDTTVVTDKNGAGSAPLLVGVVHGVAGSGPLIAMLAVTLYEPAMALAYVVTFSVGALLGMVTFGQLLCSGQRFLLDAYPALNHCVQLSLGCFAVGIGAVWLAH
ncbi:hypothetical protein R50073_19230 [Maricurvus nonylphenolicus]|uniref:HoxN/HupN/NixA family nickel/cobalt transporter n=1 Tax=Maricurvus nonylphenolicus TaxID=1008307 RepID=UPI0036F335B9